MGEEPEYQKTFRSTVNRLKNRAVYDQDKIHGIVDSAPVLHVSFLPNHVEDDPFPTILPMIGAFGTFNKEGEIATSTPTLYLHGHISSRFSKLSTPGSPTYTKARLWEEDGFPGLPGCVCATHMDGIVLALTPFNHSANYRSAVVHGYASLVTDPEEKNYALHLITDNVIPGRWANTRVPMTEAEVKATGVVKVDVVSASAKMRAHTVSNDKPDLENDAVREKVWTGVVPAYMKYGEPVPGKENVMNIVPPHVAKWIEESNRKGEAYSRDIASLPKP